MTESQKENRPTLGQPRAPESRRIAVLPLTNISPDPKDEYFADGMTEELISTLSKIADLRVIARTSVMRYKGATRPIVEIGRELNVGTLLEGSVRKIGNRIRITAQLVDSKSEEHLWSHEYDRDLEDVFGIQSDIAQRIAKALKVQILKREKAGIEKRATGSAEAYALYLKGRYFLNKRTREGSEKAIQYFEQALQRDPEYALVYTGLADSYAILALFEFLPPKEAFPKARAAAEKALGLDNSLAEAHTSLAVVKFQYDRDWSGAEREFRAAIELNPNYASAHESYANLLKALGRFDEALAETNRAQELDPLSLSVNTGGGHVLYLSRQYDRAIEQYRKALGLDPGFVQAHLWFGRPYLEKGMFKEAISEVQQAVRLSGESTIALATLGHAYASAGEGEKAKALLDRLEERSKKEYVPSYWIALIHVGLGDKDEAFRWLEAAYLDRSTWLSWVMVEPRFDVLRSDPRFNSILERMGLEAAAARQYAKPSSARETKSEDDADVRALLEQTNTISIPRFRVVGSYMRYDEHARNLLKDLKQKIVAGLESTAPKHENYLIWAPPGSGKTFFVRELKQSLGNRVEYCEMNLAETDESGFRSSLSKLASSEKPVLCFVDEVDSQPRETWPYEALLPVLDARLRGQRKVFVLAGSSGSRLKEMIEHIASRPKGNDLLSRIPDDNESEVPAMTKEDRVIIAVASLREAARESGRDLAEVEKLALYYMAVSPKFQSARRLRERVLRCVERLPVGEDRVKYDHLFGPGEEESKQFWVEARSSAPKLVNTFVLIEEPGEKVKKGPLELDKRRIAVLPFSNMSPDPSDEYFADGITEELIATISKIREVSVVSRTSMMQYRKNPKPIRDVAEELRAGTILEGSVRKAGNKVRVTVQLVDAAQDKHEWAESYDRGLEDIFAIQSDISQNVAEVLKVQLLANERQRLQNIPTRSVEAYTLFLKGRNCLNERTQQGFEKAIRYFEEAIKRDPEYASAHSGLSDCYHLLESWGFLRPQVAWPKAMEHAVKALEMDDSLAEAHASMAISLSYAKWDWKGSEREYRRAIDLNPSYATAHHWYAVHLLQTQRRWSEAIREVKKAEKLDPFSSIIATNTGRILFLAGQRDEGIGQFRHALELNPEFAYAHAELGKALVSMSSIDEGTAEIEKALELAPENIWTRADLAYAYMAASRKTDAERILRELKEISNQRYVPGTAIAGVYATLDEKDLAFEWLDKAVEDSTSTLPENMNEPMFEGLRKDPRFHKLLERVGLS